MTSVNMSAHSVVRFFLGAVPVLALGVALVVATPTMPSSKPMNGPDSLVTATPGDWPWRGEPSLRD
jgi:hypothetical protein